MELFPVVLKPEQLFFLAILLGFVYLGLVIPMRQMIKNNKANGESISQIEAELRPPDRPSMRAELDRSIQIAETTAHTMVTIQDILEDVADEMRARTPGIHEGTTDGAQEWDSDRRPPIGPGPNGRRAEQGVPDPRSATTGAGPSEELDPGPGDRPGP